MKIILDIEGMHCDGCAKRIEKSINYLEGIKTIKVSFNNKRAEIICDKEQIETIKNKIKGLGFNVVGESYEENNIKN